MDVIRYVFYRFKCLDDVLIHRDTGLGFHGIYPFAWQEVFIIEGRDCSVYGVAEATYLFYAHIARIRTTNDRLLFAASRAWCVRNVYAVPLWLKASKSVAYHIV